MIQIYMDGGAKEAEGPGKNYDLSWGIVALFKDQHVESSGARMGLARRFGGSHEDMALAEAVIFARERGYRFDQMSFFTDDIIACEAGGSLWPGNHRPFQARDLKERYAALCEAFYDPDVFKDIIECLETSRFTKVKGHARVIYNMRADYLARAAREPSFAAEPYEDWLNAGFTEQYGQDRITRWQPPFTSPQLSARGRLESMFRLALREAERLDEGAPDRPLAPKPNSGKRSLAMARLFGKRG